MKHAVGPVLRMGDEIELVIRAIRDDNPADSVEVVDYGAYVRVQRSSFLRVTRASLERYLGTGFQMSQFESIMSAFAGRIQTSSNEMVWHLKTVGDSGPEDDG